MDDQPICALEDCNSRAVMHVRHADAGYLGECFCSWEHLMEYAHAAAHTDAVPAGAPESSGLPDAWSSSNELLDWAQLRTQRAEHFIS
jgi:hypothetical protein